MGSLARERGQRRAGTAAEPSHHCVAKPASAQSDPCARGGRPIYGPPPPIPGNRKNMQRHYPPTYRDTTPDPLTEHPGSVRLRAGDVMTASEVADLMRVPRSTVEDWARRGVVPSRKVGRRRLYIREKIEALLLADDP
jgi:excisionase family DNA binding protein